MDSLSNAVLIFLRWGVILSRWGLYEHPKSHFELIKFISIKNPSNNSSNETFFTRLEGISFLIYSKIPPPLALRSSLSFFNSMPPSKMLMIFARFIVEPVNHAVLSQHLYRDYLFCTRPSPRSK